MTMIQLVYASAATTKIGEDELSAILAKARSNNASLDVSGMLLFHEGSFFQVLEGDKAVVEALYAKIGGDKRHDRVMRLLRREIKDRHFGEWQMGFVSTGSLPEDAQAGFLDFFGDNENPELARDDAKLEKLVDGFRDGRWRQSIN